MKLIVCYPSMYTLYVLSLDLGCAFVDSFSALASTSTSESKIELLCRHSSVFIMATNVPNRKHNKEITSSLRKVLYYELCAMAKDGAIPKGSYAIVGAHHGVAGRQVGRAFLEMSERIKTYMEAGGNQLDGPLPDYLFDNNRKNCKGLLKYDREALSVAIKATDIKERKTYRKMASTMGVSKTTLHRLCAKEEFLRRWTASLKPTLTEANKVQRVLYALDLIQPRPTMVTRQPQLFNDASQYVHIDEKWF